MHALDESTPGHVTARQCHRRNERRTSGAQVTLSHQSDQPGDMACNYERAAHYAHANSVAHGGCASWPCNWHQPPSRQQWKLQLFCSNNRAWPEKAIKMVDNSKHDALITSRVSCRYWVFQEARWRQKVHLHTSWEALLTVSTQASLASQVQYCSLSSKAPLVCARRRNIFQAY